MEGVGNSIVNKEYWEGMGTTVSVATTTVVDVVGNSIVKIEY